MSYVFFVLYSFVGKITQDKKTMIYIDAKVKVRARMLGKTLTVGSYPAAVAEQVKAALEPEIRAIEARALEAFREAVDKAASGKAAPNKAPKMPVVPKHYSKRRDPEEIGTCPPDKYGLTKIYKSDENDALVNCPEGFESFYDIDVPDFLYWREPGKAPKYKTEIS